MPRSKLNCFPPLARPDARVLILGSLPGAMSLAQNRYYAYPQNAFWRIMGRLFNFSPVECDYQDRIKILMAHHIAVWDVCAAAHRAGSLDTAIQNIEVNDFAAFYLAHPRIERVCFNGAKAEAVYRQKAQPLVNLGSRHFQYHRLPSTSPAHAGMSFEKKYAAWAGVLAQYGL